MQSQALIMNVNAMMIQNKKPMAKLNKSKLSVQPFIKPCNDVTINALWVNILVSTTPLSTESFCNT